jgi:hypothetical protein
MIRTDLLALNTDVLVTLANRGLVKRAAKELDAGAAPVVTAEEDGTVRGRFADGVETAFPVGAGLDTASCTCPATGVCRHRIGLVLAYQHEQASPVSVPAPASAWSPGSIGDEELRQALGVRAVTAARRRHTAGYSAYVHRGTADAPEPRVELSTCTVRFLVPGELGYAHTDAAGPNHGEAIALAVWAFREADERAPDETELRLDVGGRSVPRAERTGIEPAVELATELLSEGAMHAGPVLGAALRRMRKHIAGQGLHWPAGALDDLADQLEAYASRGARYEAERYATLLTEIHARQRATGLRSQILGGDEPGQTPLRRVRLVGLGCRIGGTLDERVADVYFAHAGDGTVLVLRRRWEETGDTPPTGHDLAGRRIAGASLAALAASNLVSESASRSASRVVRIAQGRIAKTTVTPVGTAWEQLPAGLVVRDLTAARRTLEELPPRLIRPRVEAEFVRVVQPAEVSDVGYHPGDQRLEAKITDTLGGTATVSADYRADCPGALDALAAALGGDNGTPTFVSGSLRRGRGTLVIDPIAVMTTEGVTVPDLAAGDGNTSLTPHPGGSGDQLSTALDTALTALAEVAHRGLRHLTPGVHARIERAATDLDRVGLKTSAATLTAFLASCRTEDPDPMARTWVDAQLQLTTTAELR